MGLDRDQRRLNVLPPYSSIAFIASLALHGLLIADLLAPSLPAPPMASQRKGMQLVQVKMAAPAVSLIESKIPQTAAMPPKSIHKADAAPAPSSQQAMPTTPESPPPAAPPPAAIPPMPAGSQFVSPFAPITAQPLGRGSWSHARTTPPNLDSSAPLQRQQEQLQLRNVLMDRLGNWVGWQAQQHVEANCTIRLELASRQARLSCLPAEKEAEIWSVLNGMVNAGPANGADAFCLQIGSAQFGVISCDAAP